MSRTLVTIVLAFASFVVPSQAQEKPGSPLPTSSQGEPAVPADIAVALVHSVRGGGACAKHDRGGVCDAADHWQAEIAVVGARPVTASMARSVDLRERLAAAAALRTREEPKQNITVRAPTLCLRAGPHTPCGCVQDVQLAAASAGIWQIEFAVVGAGGDAEQRLIVPLPIDPGTAAVGEDTASRVIPVGIGLFVDPITGACVRHFGGVLLAAGKEGDSKLRRLVADSAADRRRLGIDADAVVDVSPSVAWQDVVAVLDTLVASRCVITFTNPAASLAGSPKDKPAYQDLHRAFASSEGWRALTLADFVDVNGDADTWTEKDGVILGTGKPLGGARSKQQVTNFELVLEWKHHEFAGNSGVFVWCPESAFADLPRGTLPRSGIEVQVLDLGYEEQWLKDKGKHSDWFTSHGDLFPVGDSTMRPFTPKITYMVRRGETFEVGSDNGSRCFPTQRLTRPAGEWNHYYVRAINGEIRLWVNGWEVSGGTKCTPARGYLALEAEGAKIEFRNLRLRELP